jgi:hypothetical protein
MAFNRLSGAVAATQAKPTLPSKAGVCVTKRATFRQPQQSMTTTQAFAQRRQSQSYR